MLVMERTDFQYCITEHKVSMKDECTTRKQTPLWYSTIIYLNIKSQISLLITKVNLIYEVKYLPEYLLT